MKIPGTTVQLAYVARVLKSKKEGPTTYSVVLEVTVWGGGGRGSVEIEAQVDLCYNFCVSVMPGTFKLLSHVRSLAYHPGTIVLHMTESQKCWGLEATCSPYTGI